MRLRVLASVATAAICAVGLVAAKPGSPPTTTNFDPEIAYSYASANYMDLRLANRQGTAAVLVHRAASGALSTFDLAPETAGIPNRISYAERDKGLFVRTWTKDPVAISAASQIHPGPIEGSDFSPDANKLAFSVTGTQPGIMIHDFAPTAGQPPQRMLTDQYYAYWVRWDPAGETIFFSGALLSSEGPIKLYKIDVASTDGIATPLFDIRPNDLGVDVTRAPASDASRLIYDYYGALYLSKLDGTERTKLTDGSLAHFNCSNAAIIHRGAGRKRPTLITALASPQAPSTWSSDSNIRHIDWLQRSPCI